MSEIGKAAENSRISLKPKAGTDSWSALYVTWSIAINEERLRIRRL
jgi:hypothetical protein